MVAGDFDDEESDFAADDDSDFPDDDDDSLEELDVSDELDESLEPELSELADELELEEPDFFDASRLSLR